MLYDDGEVSKFDTLEEAHAHIALLEKRIERVLKYAWQPVSYDPVDDDYDVVSFDRPAESEAVADTLRLVDDILQGGIDSRLS